MRGPFRYHSLMSVAFDICSAGLSLCFAPEKNSSWRTSRFGTTAGSACKATSPSTEFRRQAVLGRFAKSLVGWKRSFIFVTPETVVRWHRTGFRLYWSCGSRELEGRSKGDQSAGKCAN